MPAWNIAAAQYGVQPGNLRANISHHLDFIHHAAAEQIDLLVFPELSLTGYPRKMRLASPFLLPMNLSLHSNGLLSSKILRSLSACRCAVIQEY